MNMESVWKQQKRQNPLNTDSQGPTGRVFQYRVGSGRVLDKIPGIGSGSGRVGVSKYANGYFRVSLLVSGIFRYFGYFDPIPVSSSGYPFRGGPRGRCPWVYSLLSFRKRHVTQQANYRLAYIGFGHSKYSA